MDENIKNEAEETAKECAEATPEKEEKFSLLMHEDYAKKQVRKPPRFKK